MEKAQKEWRKLERRMLNCQTDAEKALEQFNQKWKYHQVNARAVAVLHYARRGRTSADVHKEAAGWKLDGSLEENAKAIAEAKQSLGRFITVLRSQSILEKNQNGSWHC